MKTQHTYMVRKIINRILNELEASNFIDNPKAEKIDGAYMYSYRKNFWKDIASFLPDIDN